MAQPYGYTGREVDAETGLMYYRARYYDPGTGQFISSDPIGFLAGDTNTYAYVWNDPYSWSDPTGLTASGENAGVTGGNLALNKQAQTGFAGITYCLANVAQTTLQVYNAWLYEQMNTPGEIVEFDPLTPSLGVAYAEGCLFRGITRKRPRPSCTARSGRGGGGGFSNAIVGGLAGALAYASSSFAEGTLVTTADGPVPIEVIREGDLVLARHETTGELAYAEVTALMARDAPSLLRITLEAEDGTTSTLSVTAEHPLFVAGKGWVLADAVAAGDSLRSAELAPLAVTAVEVDETPTRVQNLEVSGAKTYFAGGLEAWAHNQRAASPRGGHGKTRHCGCQAYPSKSKYHKSAQREKLINRTKSRPDTVEESNNRIVYRKRYGRRIVRCGERDHLVVVRKKSGNLVTDYPAWGGSGGVP